MSQIETCSIQLKVAPADFAGDIIFGTPTYKFVAQANGRSGPFIAGESETVRGEPDISRIEHFNALDSLHQTLIKNRWQFIHAGSEWWEYHYERTKRKFLFF